MIDLEGTKKYILDKLQKELNPDLKYHGISHTIDVFNSATVIAAMEKINEKDLLLLQTAALYHDSGFLLKYKGHEEISVMIAQDVLPKFGYQTHDIDIISQMIMATRIPQTPHSLLDEILSDADLDYLGRDDFFMNAMRLKHEWMEYGIITTLKDWYFIQNDFLSKHTFFTNSAKKLRQEKKMIHLSQIKELLSL
ncbi:MAG: HD domain protein [Bacteroidetes bacterium ADurb.Bin408]|nr:MAG: HD domain protein [Bacteroidetes bacterium ADurb.Bin408]